MCIYIYIHVSSTYVTCHAARCTACPTCRPPSATTAGTSATRCASASPHSKRPSHIIPRGPLDLILRSGEQNFSFRTIFGRNRGRKQIPCDAPINLDKFSASDVNSEPISREMPDLKIRSGGPLGCHDTIYVY